MLHISIKYIVNNISLEGESSNTNSIIKTANFFNELF